VKTWKIKTEPSAKLSYWSPDNYNSPIGTKHLGRGQFSFNSLTICSFRGYLRTKTATYREATPAGFEPAISTVTGWHVRPLHQGALRIIWATYVAQLESVSSTGLRVKLGSRFPLLLPVPAFCFSLLPGIYKMDVNLPLL
jgi:hypothetical protein